LTPQEIALVAGLCRARAGLAAPANAYSMESRLEPVARAAGFAGITAMLAAAGGERGETVAWRVVEAMTCAETSFFDDKAVFHVLETDVLPSLARSRAGAPIRVWSAACSTGQEIYSLAMLAEHIHRSGGEARLDLAASDISAGALERARSGLYTQFEVQRGLPIRLLVSHFEKVGEAWRISANLRRQVRWRRINLVADLTGVGEFDVIFCRNVLCGMDPASRARVLEALSTLLPEDGYLVLGSREEAAGEAFAAGPHPAIRRPRRARHIAAA